MHFEHEDIIITDPCYVVRKGEDWEKVCGIAFDGEFSLEDVDIPVKSLCRDTIYGDWSCTVFEDETEKKLGKFCADAGLVGVFKLSDVLKYYPKFEEEYLSKDWVVTRINDFTGDVKFKEYSDGDGAFVEVEGKGSVNFVGRQTGF